MKRNHYLLAFFSIQVLLILHVIPIYAQSWQWADQIKSRGMVDVVYGVSDSAGNFYISAEFDDTCFVASDTLIPAQSDDFLIAKYDFAGNVIWVKQISTSNNSFEHKGCISDITFDNVGNILITGLFYGSLSLPPYDLYSDYGDMFVAKFSPECNCIWARQSHGGDYMFGRCIAVDSVYNVYVSGYNSWTSLFDTISVPQGCFLAKYDSSGVCLWAKSVIPEPGFYGGGTIFSMLPFQGMILLNGTGDYEHFTIDTMSIYHPGMETYFLAGFTLDGNISWINQGVSPRVFGGGNISFDGNRNIYTTGFFGDSLKFASATLYGVARWNNTLICKYTKAGELLWARACLASQASTGDMVKTDQNGNCYLTGSFSGIGFFGADTVTSEAGSDVYLTKFTPSGDCQGVMHFGSSIDDNGYGLGLDPDDNPYIAGGFRGTVQIGGTTLENYGSPYWGDGFVAKCSAFTGFFEKKEPKDNQLLIYANPNEGKCIVTIPDEFKNEKRLTLSIFDNQGKMIQQTPVEMNAGKISLNIQAEAAGVYNVILSNGKKNYSGKIIFQ
jgi:hypothetical protein